MVLETLREGIVSEPSYTEARRATVLQNRVNPASIT